MTRRHNDDEGTIEHDTPAELRAPASTPAGEQSIVDWEAPRMHEPGQAARVLGLVDDDAGDGDVASRGSSDVDEEPPAHTMSGHGFADEQPGDTPIDEPPLPSLQEIEAAGYSREAAQGIYDRQLAIVGAWRAGARTHAALREAMDQIDAAAERAELVDHAAAELAETASRSRDWEQHELDDAGVVASHGDRELPDDAGVVASHGDRELPDDEKPTTPGARVKPKRGRDR